MTILFLLLAQLFLLTWKVSILANVRIGNLFSEEFSFLDAEKWKKQLFRGIQFALMMERGSLDFI